MKSFFKFLLIFSSILLVSATLAPILFDFLPFKFERIFNRLVMVFSLIAIFVNVRIRRETFIQYGLLGNQNKMKHFWKGFASAWVVLSLFGLAAVLAGQARWAPRLEAGLLVFSFFKNMTAAVLIGFIEEFFFRGFIFSTLKNRLGLGLGVSFVATSLFYSLIHFVSGESPFVGPDPTFWDSLRLMSAPFSSLLNWRPIWTGAVGLFLFGLILNGLFLRTQSLYPSIGLHAGCVFFVKMDSLFVDFLGKAPLWWGSSQIYDGVIGWVFLGLLGLGVMGFMFKSVRERELKQRVGLG